MELSSQFHAPAALPPGKEPLVPLDRDWVSPRAGLDAVVKRKIPSPCRDSNPPIIQPLAQRCTPKLSRLTRCACRCICSCRCRCRCIKSHEYTKGAESEDGGLGRRSVLWVMDNSEKSTDSVCHRTLKLWIRISIQLKQQF
jgi:hypothetical protein